MSSVSDRTSDTTRDAAAGADQQLRHEERTVANRGGRLLATGPRYRVDEQRLESLEIMHPFVVAQRDADDAGRGVARDPD